MDGKPEYECLKDCLPTLRVCAQNNLLSLSCELLAARLISDDNEESLRNSQIGEAERAAKLVSLVMNKIKEDCSNYHVFLDVLKKDDQYNIVVKKVEDSFAHHSSGLKAPVANGMCLVIQREGGRQGNSQLAVVD